MFLKPKRAKRISYPSEFKEQGQDDSEILHFSPTMFTAMQKITSPEHSTLLPNTKEGGKNKALEIRQGYHGTIISN